MTAYILLTILSVLASWIITQMYTTSQYKTAIGDVKEEHRSNLRTYALKAAEKVNNLSNELNKLSIYLEQELNYTDYRTTDEELLAKEERIESAIHVIRTLKSVNDTALSDWEGVIGDELNQRREEQEEKEEELKALIGRVESLIEDQRQDFVGTQKDAKSVRQEVEKLKHELRLATLQLSDTSLPRRVRNKQPKQDVEANCPICKDPVKYSQRASVRSVKLVLCKSCGSKLVSTYAEPTGFGLKLRQSESIDGRCPICGSLNPVVIDNYPGSHVVVACSNCENSFRLNKTIDGTEVKQINSESPPPAPALSEDIISRVRDALPPQPWPTGTHYAVAEKLALTPATVRRATSELIRRGMVHHQVDGVVYVPRDESKTATP